MFGVVSLLVDSLSRYTAGWWREHILYVATLYTYR